MVDAEDEYGKQTSSPTFCCEILIICGRDNITPLSREKRLEYLISGYIRELSSNIGESSVRDIMPIFQAVIGNPYDFGYNQLMTLKESGLNCCGYNTFWGKCILCTREICKLLWNTKLTVWCTTTLVIKLCLDIMALSAAESNDTTTTSLKTIDSTIWRRVGAISDIFISVLLVIMTFMMGGRKYREWSCSWGLRQIYYCVGPVVIMFIGLWSIFGFVLFFDMEQNGASTDILLWCIGQLTLTVIVPIGMCLYDVKKRGFECVPFTYIDEVYAQAYVLITYCPTAIKICKAVAAIVIGLTFDCNDAGISLFDWLDVNTWMLMAGFTDFVISVMWLLGSFKCKPEHWEGKSCVLCGCWVFVFDALMIVFGFMLWSDMDADPVCSKMVLSWSIIECVPMAFSFCSTVAFFCVLGAIGSIVKNFD